VPAFALGTVELVLTTTALLAVHPFEGSVTVNEYVPAAFTEGEAVFPPETIPGPVQLNVAPVVAEEPFNVITGDEHVIVCVEPAFASGADELELTVTDEEAVQPLEGSVTVRKYVPAALTDGAAVFPPETIPGPDQLKVAPGVDDEPLSVTEGDEQLSVTAVPALAFGVPVFAFTATVLVALQLFDGLLTVKV
jgi:hypothetical protein